MTDKRADFLALLKAQHTFPGPYTMKFIGKAENNFVGRLVAAVRQSLNATEDPPHATQPSKNSGYVSVTLMPIVPSAEAILAVYDQVQQVEGLKVSL